MQPEVTWFEKGNRWRVGKMDHGLKGKEKSKVQLGERGWPGPDMDLIWHIKQKAWLERKYFNVNHIIHDDESSMWQGEAEAWRSHLKEGDDMVF